MLVPYRNQYEGRQRVPHGNPLAESLDIPRIWSIFSVIFVVLSFLVKPSASAQWRTQCNANAANWPCAITRFAEHCLRQLSSGFSMVLPPDRHSRKGFEKVGFGEKMLCSVSSKNIRGLKIWTWFGQSFPHHLIAVFITGYPWMARGCPTFLRQRCVCVPLAAPRLKSSRTLIGGSLKTQRKWRNWSYWARLVNQFYHEFVNAGVLCWFGCDYINIIN